MREEALGAARRAVALREGTPGDPLLLAEARLALAQALRQSGEDPALAAKLVQAVEAAVNSEQAPLARRLARELAATQR
jgi:hypothetical protein